LLGAQIAYKEGKLKSSQEKPTAFIKFKLKEYLNMIRSDFWKQHQPEKTIAEQRLKPEDLASLAKR
jgi:hypothetical protein